ncbi:MAG: MBL fold metallo-hydrolase [Clostridiales bacterium]|nr:MBL fold metallo-hydrolase [Clostridiales bacterium]
MYQVYQTKQLRDGLVQISEKYAEKAPAVYMYLVIGQERAALIDSGFGMVDTLRPLVEQLTEKPILCIVAHGHPDHVGGAAQFDEVYLNEADAPLLADSLSVERRVKDVFGRGDVSDEVRAYSETHMVGTQGLQYKPMAPGDVFDLGGVTLEVFAMPGHTLGSVALLNRKDNYALVSDGFSRRTAPEARVDLADYAAGLEQFQAAIREDTPLYWGHGVDPVDHAYLRDMCTACKEVVAGDTAGDVESVSRRPSPVPMPKRWEHRCGSVTLAYFPRKQEGGAAQ